LITYLNEVLLPFDLGDLLLKTLRALACGLFRFNVLPFKLLGPLFLSASGLEFKNFKNENIISNSNIKPHAIKSQN